MVIERLNTKAAILAVQDSGSHVASQLWFLQHLAAGCLEVVHAALGASLAACQQQPAWDLAPFLQGPPQFCEPSLSPGVIAEHLVFVLEVVHAALRAAPAACQPQPAWDLPPFLQGSPQFCEPFLSPGVLAEDLTLKLWS